GGRRGPVWEATALSCAAAEQAVEPVALPYPLHRANLARYLVECPSRHVRLDRAHLAIAVAVVAERRAAVERERNKRAEAGGRKLVRVRQRLLHDAFPARHHALAVDSEGHIPGDVDARLEGAGERLGRAPGDAAGRQHGGEHRVRDAAAPILLDLCAVRLAEIVADPYRHTRRPARPFRASQLGLVMRLLVTSSETIRSNASSEMRMATPCLSVRVLIGAPPGNAASQAFCGCSGGSESAFASIGCLRKNRM